MGRTSKFSFPMPGRRHTTTRDNIPPLPTPYSISGSNLSKAQRILGTDNDLNIDSPVRDTVDYAWRHSGSRSSGMSISISESTQSTNESGSEHETQNEQWDQESGVFPNSQMLGGKPSSTLLGRRFRDDGTTTSGASAHLRHNDSSSTLKSYYDRQKSPLSISQQTSASSARDLALRKGFPPVVQRSPLLQVESSDRFDNFAGKDSYIKEGSYQEDVVPDKMRKKPARLDLTMLFPRSRKHRDKTPADLSSSSPSPSSILTNTSRTSSQPPDSSRRKLKKASSKESILSQKNSVRTNRSHDPQTRPGNGTLSSLYDHYEDMPVQTPHMERIPEASIPDRLAARAQKDGHGQSKLQSNVRPPVNSGTSAVQPEKEPFSWKNVRSSILLSPYELSSAASISSRNTKTSRHTAGSQLSQSDLKDKSVLSLSSDSEGDFSDSEPVKSPSVASSNNLKIPQSAVRPSHRLLENRRQSSQQPGGLTARAQTQRNGAAKETPYLTIPETTPRSTRFSGLWQPPPMENCAPSRRNEHRVLVQKEKRSSRKPPSIRSIRSGQQRTPPLSPSSMEFCQTSDRSSRFMAVTKQEEALLEALRQKRARMREEIIEEHETAKTPSPPRMPERNASRHSAHSSISTLHKAPTTNGKQKVLLYLDTPLSRAQTVDTSEPSPDLSDFLSFGSDENSTPRNSWAPSRKDQARPDSFASPHPATPPSAVRLSAVGSNNGFKDGRLLGDGITSKKRTIPAVRFVDDSKVNAQDFLLDDHESGAIWGM